MNCFIVYKTINLVNQKIYVGQHNTSADDGYLGSGKLFLRALSKYGKENFKREIIEFCTSANINEKEDYWIDLLNARNPKIGYNICKGGWGNKNGFIESQETKTKKSKSHTGMKHSKETRDKISQSHQTYWSNLDPEVSEKRKENLRKNRAIGKRKGTETSEQAKINMSIAQKKIGHIGNKNNNSKYVWNFISPFGNIYENVYDSMKFCEKFKLNQPGILYAVKHSGIYKGWKISRRLINP